MNVLWKTLQDISLFSLRNPDISRGLQGLNQFLFIFHMYKTFVNFKSI
ncbi:hypothetical protein MmTuc01_1415 [Methanosarcina mazei Tuc01]|uniref:Uncharacterized protein n=1 Tax=Methanosarcina mazei Tuc01 TaxID=1236903 RepID=M1QIJ2_METMZ|nr:hypothetical protein MmTuc01_1415 [Methanosarcina mazei Tuc01]